MQVTFEDHEGREHFWACLVPLQVRITWRHPLAEPAHSTGVDAQVVGVERGRLKIRRFVSSGSDLEPSVLVPMDWVTSVHVY